MNTKFFNVLRKPNQAVLDLLNNNIIGTPGHGMLYQHLGVSNKIQKIARPFFVNLIRKAALVGTCCFCERATLNNGAEIKAFYIRYFSFKNSFRRKTVSQKKLFRSSALRSEISNLLEGEYLETKPSEKFFHYAYVDPRNIRSAMLCAEFGFEKVREYATIIFSRLNPKAAETSIIQEVTESDEPQVKQLVTEFYEQYNMFSIENLLGGRKYYIVKNETGDILAGAQVNPDQWRILSLPGVTGNIVLNLFTHLPLLHKLINKNYQFITIEGVFYRQGYESKLNELLEHLLHLYCVNSAILVVDAETQLYKDLRKLKLGPVDKLNKEVKGNVICRFKNFTNEEKKSFNLNPAYISGIDVT